MSALSAEPAGWAMRAEHQGLLQKSMPETPSRAISPPSSLPECCATCIAQSKVVHRASNAPENVSIQHAKAFWETHCGSGKHSAAAYRDGSRHDAIKPCAKLLAAEEMTRFGRHNQNDKAANHVKAGGRQRCQGGRPPTMSRREAAISYCDFHRATHFVTL